jgi:hypothetical protein
MSWLTKVFGLKIEFHEFTREDGLETIDLPGIGYGGWSPSIMFWELKKGHKFRKIDRNNDFMRYAINFSLDDQKYTFFSSDWGGGFINPMESHGKVAPLLEIMRGNPNFVEVGVGRGRNSQGSP